MVSLVHRSGHFQRIGHAGISSVIALLALTGLFLAPLAGAQETPPPTNDEVLENPPSPSVPVSVEESVGVDASELVAESTARVVLAQFTTAIENREPIDQVSFVGTDVRKIYFFSDLRGLEGSVVTHNWRHGGAVLASVDFAVNGPRWRVWSSKELTPKLVGDWTVEIVTADGEVLASETFTYSAVDG